MKTAQICLQLPLNVLLDAVKELNHKDKLLVSNAIWSGDLEIPIEHQKVVLKRMDKAKKDKSQFVEWDKIKW